MTRTLKILMGLAIWHYLIAASASPEWQPISAHSISNGMYISKYIDANQYRNILRDFERTSRLSSTNIAYHKEFKEALPFIRQLGADVEPDLAAFCSHDINVDPITVLWAECLLALDGRLTRVRLPMEFRYLGFVMSFGSYLKADEHRAVVGKLYLDAVSRLGKDSFLQSFYHDEYDDPYTTFWNTQVPTCIKWSSTHYMSSTCNFVRNLLLLRYDVSAWFWDRRFAEKLATAYAPRQFRQKYRHETTYVGSRIIESQVAVAYDELSRQKALSFLNLNLENESAERCFTGIYTDLFNEYTADTKNLYAAFTNYIVLKDADREWVASTMESIAAEIHRLTPVRGLNVIEQTTFSGTYIVENHKDLDEYSQLDLPDKGKLSGGEYQKIRSFLLNKDTCLNRLALARIVDHCNWYGQDHEFWARWKNEVQSRLSIHAHYYDCVKILKRNLREEQWEFLHFWPMMHEMRAFIESIRADKSAATPTPIGVSP